MVEFSLALKLPPPDISRSTMMLAALRHFMQRAIVKWSNLHEKLSNLLNFEANCHKNVFLNEIIILIIPFCRVCILGMQENMYF